VTEVQKSFFGKCYEVAAKIPQGRVTTYGAIAKYLGAARSARMVGWAMNKTKGSDVPAHRVVNRTGHLTGRHHFDGVNLMKQLLQNEGVKFDGDQILNFKEVFWDPAEE
jgi:methylated-DNA-protein-cysteine methyltransferase-like protein